MYFDCVLRLTFNVRTRPIKLDFDIVDDYIDLSSATRR
jgi:hypothetical protein